MDDKERLKIVLKHLVEHNEGHIEDYRRWVELAKNAGLDNVADLIEQANDHIVKAGQVLKSASELVK